MKIFSPLLLVGVLCVTNVSASAGETKGVIARAYESGRPVIFKLETELPPQSVRAGLRWLTVIAWKYDANDNNGMPTEANNEQMISLEDAIDTQLVAQGLVRHAYSRTGNGLKEFVYYIRDRDEFLSAFNEALAERPPYPIEITFYEDPDWQELSRIIGEVAGSA